MPRTPDLQIKRVWRFKNEPDRVHFMIATADGGERHLWQLNDTPLGRVLGGHLLALGYTGPASGEIEDESGGLEAEG